MKTPPSSTKKKKKEGNTELAEADGKTKAADRSATTDKEKEGTAEPVKDLSGTWLGANDLKGRRVKKTETKDKDKDKDKTQKKGKKKAKGEEDRDKDKDKDKKQKKDEPTTRKKKKKAKGANKETQNEKEPAGASTSGASSAGREGTPKSKKRKEGIPGEVIDKQQLGKLLSEVKLVRALKSCVPCPGEIRAVRKTEGQSTFTQIFKGSPSRVLGQISDKMFGTSAQSAVAMLVAAAEAGFEKDDLIKIKTHLLAAHRLKAD